MIAFLFTNKIPFFCCFFFCEGFISEFKKLWDFSIRSPSGVLQISTLYQYFMIHKSVDFLCVSTQDRTANIILKSTDELWLVLMHNVGVIFIIFWLEYGLYFCVHSQKYCKPLVLEDLSYYRTVRGKLDPFLNYNGIFNIHYLVQDLKSSPANKLFLAHKELFNEISSSLYLKSTPKAHMQNMIQRTYFYWYGSIMVIVY